MRFSRGWGPSSVTGSGCRCAAGAQPALLHRRSAAPDTAYLDWLLSWGGASAAPVTWSVVKEMGVEEELEERGGGGLD